MSPEDFAPGSGLDGVAPRARAGPIRVRARPSELARRAEIEAAAHLALSPPTPARLGSILVREGVIAQADLERSLARQRLSQARLGEILVASGVAPRSAVAAAAARQKGIGFVDLDATPAECDLARDADLDVYLRNRIMPWRRENGRTVFAAASPEAARAALAAMADPPRAARFVMAEDRALREGLVGALSPALASRAAERRPADMSLRDGAAKWQRRLVRAAAVGAGALVAAYPAGALTAGLWGLASILGVNAAVWLGALAAGVSARRGGAARGGAGKGVEAGAGAAADRLADFRPSPKVTILAPLYREPEMVGHLIRALAAIDYPAELLDVKIILEAGDDETRAAIERAAPPANIDVLIAPDGAPRTKPRALNFAMDFAEGEIIGIYDAEDRPPPDQVRKVVERLAASPAEVACVQARLGYYNAGENWLTRCFEIEYASWFDTMLPGLRRLSMPIPLGGTSLFIRRGALDAVGGWDSHNVTEDADLGMMLARAGLETVLCETMTEEEASSRPGAWVRQRSRWLKGYLATWTTHMRRPLSLWRDLGTWRMIGFNAVLLSAVAGYLASPFVWIAAIAAYFTGGFADVGPQTAMAFEALRWAAWASLPALFGAAFVGLRRRKRLRMLGWTLALPFYWILGAVAAYMAAWELARAPYKWRKTTHGVGRIAGARAARMGRRRAAEPSDAVGCEAGRQR